MLRFFKNRRVLSWSLYDWANSAFATTVMAGFFPLFFKNYICADLSSELSSLQLGLANSASSLLLAVAAPFLAAFADLRLFRKLLLLIFTVFGSLFTAALYYSSQGAWLQGTLLYGLGAFCFGGAIIFYDSFLPDVSQGDSADEISGLGYALGYLGGGLLFALNVWMFLKPQLFGLADSTAAVKVSFITVALWWLLFSIPLMVWVPEGGIRPAHLEAERLNPLRALKQTLILILGRTDVLLFLAAYWIYIDGVNTVIKMAIDYGIAVGLPSAHLIGALLVTQFVGFPSALIYCRLSRFVGTRRMIGCGLTIYALSAIWASQIAHTWEFYGLAIVIGLVQGGVQALSRSLFSTMVPSERSAEYFSFFNLVGKFATIAGPALIGITTYITGSHRVGILSLTVIFVLGYWLLERSEAGVIERRAA